MKQASREPKRFRGVSHNVFFLGWVSFLTDVSSEMIFNVFPLFLSHVLGMGALFIGITEGLGDSVATILKVSSGWASDKLCQRKGLTTFGYILSTAAKPFLLLATSGAAALVIRFFERAGKGIRTSPRDALIADSTIPGAMGRGFGFHRAMDTAGAVVGMAIAAAIVYFIQGWELTLALPTFHWLIIIGIIPAVISVIVIIFFVHETRSPHPKEGRMDIAGAGGFDRRFKIFLAIMVIFTLGNSADIFLVLRASDIGLSPLHILLMLIPLTLVYTVTSYPSGKLSDRIGRKRVIIAGWGIYVLTYLGFALASPTWHVIYIVMLFSLYGVYYGAAEGVTRAFVADTVPKEKRGTAYGLYHGSIGISLLLASVMAGIFWETIDPAATFLFGAAMAGASILGLMLFIKE
jgi:MFS family permease